MIPYTSWSLPVGACAYREDFKKIRGKLKVVDDDDDDDDDDEDEVWQVVTTSSVQVHVLHEPSVKQNILDPLVDEV